jgi:hypothetical protein
MSTTAAPTAMAAPAGYSSALTGARRRADDDGRAPRRLEVRVADVRTELDVMQAGRVARRVPHSRGFELVLVRDLDGD